MPIFACTEVQCRLRGCELDLPVWCCKRQGRATLVVAVLGEADCYHPWLPFSLFWEMFAGKAGFTWEFLRQGLPCGPPLDKLKNPEVDLLNFVFLAIVLGLISERLIRVLHLGPPCVSFSMACNQF